MKTLTPTRFQYNLSLLNGGSTTVRVEQKVNGVYQYLATQQTQTTSGTYELSFVPTETDIRISVSGTSRYALNNLYLDRDQIDTLVATYAMSRGYRYGFNGMERDDEVKGRGNSYTTEFRQYDPRVGRWLSLDPEMTRFPAFSPYLSNFNNPITYIDPLGNAPTGDYFSYSGKYLGSDGKDDKKVYVADKKNDDGSFQNAKDLKINMDQFKGFASLIWNESSGDKTESFAIGNAVMNYLEKGGSKQINSLDAILLKPNAYSRGVTQADVNEYSNAEKNSRHEFEAVINAVMRVNYPELITETAFLDYSNGATHWDGYDLVDAFSISNGKVNKISNSHRGYTWSESSKSILNSYFDKFGQESITYKGVTYNQPNANPKNWKYSKTNFATEATRARGGSLFNKVNGFGEGYNKGATNIDYSNLKLF